MDIQLIRTFLEVAATGSFVNASERLYVTQSAVSLRIQRLEESGTAEDLDIKWRNRKADSSEGKTDPMVEVSVRTEQ